MPARQPSAEDGIHGEDDGGQHRRGQGLAAAGDGELASAAPYPQRDGEGHVLSKVEADRLSHRAAS